MGNAKKFQSSLRFDRTPSIVCALKKGANHGYGALVSNLGGNNRLRRLGCRRDDRCRLAFGLDAHGTTCRHCRIAQLYEAFRDARASLVTQPLHTGRPHGPGVKSVTVPGFLTSSVIRHGRDCADIGEVAARALVFRERRRSRRIATE